MGRLTIRIDGEAYIEKVANKYCKDVCSSRNRCNDCPIRDAFNKLAHYEDLEEQGRLIELPCKVGDDVYFIPSKTNYKLNVLNHLEENNRVYHQKIERITIAKKYYIVECDADREYGTGRYFINDSFGETWFLTKEEAEAKLKELKEGGTDG